MQRQLEGTVEADDL
jgi:transposase